jgi:hypothetical protein
VSGVHQAAAGSHSSAGVRVSTGSASGVELHVRHASGGLRHLTDECTLGDCTLTINGHAQVPEQWGC